MKQLEFSREKFRPPVGESVLEGKILKGKLVKLGEWYDAGVNFCQ